MAYPAITEKKLSVNMDMTRGIMEDAGDITDNELNEVIELVAQHGYDSDVESTTRNCSSTISSY
jgi:hypothetical protein